MLGLRNNQGLWSSSMASVLIEILPPYYQTWWFRTLGFLTTLGLGFSVYMVRRNQRKQLENTRKRIADDLHDDIGSKMSSIALDIELAKLKINGESEVGDDLKEVAETARGVVDSLTDSVWFVDAGNDNLKDLVLRMKKDAGKLLRGKTYTFTGPEPLPNVSVDMETRRHLFLFFKEAVNNASKHAGDAHVKASVSYYNGELVIEVSDDGPGFDASDAMKKGRGMTTMRSRAEDELNGIFTVNSSKGEGTSIVLQVRIT